MKFCNECGSRLETEGRPVAEERKVVSVLFCDLVGFTSLAEGKDPEDVRATLRPYHELLRRDIESYGGTVEKFIGDAIMAVFGAPTSHEDDPVCRRRRSSTERSEASRSRPTSWHEGLFGVNTEDA